MTTGTGCAHFMREPGTENSITMMMKMGAFGNHIEVQRFTPDNPGKYRIVLKTMRPIKQCDLEYNARKLPQTFHIMRPLI